MKEDIITIAIPKGRVAKEVVEKLFPKLDLIAEEEFFDDNSRKLVFTGKIAGNEIRILMVKNSDVITFVDRGVANIGIAGLDVILEKSHDGKYSNFYKLLDLGIAKCRMSVAGRKGLKKASDFHRLRVATKYPYITEEYFAGQGVAIDCIELSGSVELAASLGMADKIVDLVDSGRTLKANDLVEEEIIMQITSWLICNKTSYVVKNKVVSMILEKLV